MAFYAKDEIFGATSMLNEAKRMMQAKHDPVALFGLPITNVTMAKAVARVQEQIRSHRSHQIVTVNLNLAHNSLEDPKRKKLILLAALPLAILGGLWAAVFARKRDLRLDIHGDVPGSLTSVSQPDLAVLVTEPTANLVVSTSSDLPKMDEVMPSEANADLREACNPSAEPACYPEQTVAPTEKPVELALKSLALSPETVKDLASPILSPVEENAVETGTVEAEIPVHMAPFDSYENAPEHRQSKGSAEQEPAQPAVSWFQRIFQGEPEPSLGNRVESGEEKVAHVSVFDASPYDLSLQVEPESFAPAAPEQATHQVEPPPVAEAPLSEPTVYAFAPQAVAGYVAPLSSPTPLPDQPMEASIQPEPTQAIPHWNSIPLNRWEPIPPLRSQDEPWRGSGLLSAQQTSRGVWGDDQPMRIAPTDRWVSPEDVAPDAPPAESSEMVLTRRWGLLSRFQQGESFRSSRAAHLGQPEGSRSPEAHDPTAQNFRQDDEPEHNPEYNRHRR